MQEISVPKQVLFGGSLPCLTNPSLNTVFCCRSHGEGWMVTCLGFRSDAWNLQMKSVSSFLYEILYAVLNSSGFYLYMRL